MESRITTASRGTALPSAVNFRENLLCVVSGGVDGHKSGDSLFIRDGEEFGCVLQRRRGQRINRPVCTRNATHALLHVRGDRQTGDLDRSRDD